MSEIQVINTDPTYDEEAEQALLSAVLTGGARTFDDVTPFVSADDMFLVRHGYIWQAYTNIRSRNDLIDYITVQSELRSMGLLADVGGPAYLIELLNAFSDHTYAEVYARLVQKTAVRRRGLAFADDLTKAFKNGNVGIDKIKVEVEKALTKLWGSAFDGPPRDWANILGGIMGDIEYRMDNPATLMGVPTGWRGLDDLIAGYQRSDLIILAGRPGMGKTSAMISSARSALAAGARVGFISQEMSGEQIAYRVLSGETGINSQKLRLNRLELSEWGKFTHAVGNVGNLPFYVDDSVRVTPTQLRQKALRWQRESGLDLLFVDYLQILSSGGMFKGEARTQEVGYFARELKQIARELRIPVIAAAQLSRALETRQDKHPILSDLRESGEIEQEADIIGFLYNESVYDENADPCHTELIIAKHRNGPTGTVNLHFDKATTKFTDARAVTVDWSSL